VRTQKKKKNLFQICLAYEVPNPKFRQPYGDGDSRIVAGQPAKRGQFPHQAAMIMDGRAFCGGSLISKNWVMTAAHCVKLFSLWLIQLGQTSRQVAEPGTVIVKSFKGITHENYDSPTIANDIGLIQLPEDIQFSGEP